MKDMFQGDGPFMKACGMMREEDIAAVNKAKPRFCGFIIDYPKSHRSLSYERAEELARSLDDDIVPVGVFVDARIEDITGLVKGGVITVVQLHGAEDEAYIEKLKQEASPSAIIKAFQVRTGQDVHEACASSADMILLDSGKGSGETFDWTICKNATRPFILAGGLNADNVARAISQTGAWGADMSSGLETDKIKDADKIMESAHILKELQK